MYCWTITKDNLATKGEKSDVGVCGPRTYPLGPDAVKKHPDRVQFRMKDDDGEIYYYGFVVVDQPGSEELFAPLDDFGTPNAGCTSIELKENGEWKQL